MTKREQEKLLEALNFLDEMASFETADNDNGEAHKQEKAYTLLFDFIKKQV